jgi:AcrR family transcriptional regulator
MNPGATSRRAGSAATRTHLLSAARDLFLERGYEATPVRAIAEKADVTIGAFYGHFGSKRMALFAVVRAMNEQVPRRRSPFPTSAHRALVLAVASFAHEDIQAAAVLTEVLQVLAPGIGGALDTSRAGDLLVNLTR